MLPPPPISTLFPYTTLFRSVGDEIGDAAAEAVGADGHAHRTPGPERDVAAVPLRRVDHVLEQLGQVHRHRLLARSEEHTSELQSLRHLVCRLLLEKKKKRIQ